MLVSQIFVIEIEILRDRKIRKKLDCYTEYTVCVCGETSRYSLHLHFSCSLSQYTEHLKKFNYHLQTPL